MADPPVTAPPGDETPVANTGTSPRFFRDMSKDAFFAEEAGSEPSKRKLDGDRKETWRLEVHDERYGKPVGRLRLLKYPVDAMLLDFNPLENLAYSGAKLVDRLNEKKIEAYEDLGAADAGPQTGPVADDDASDIMLAQIEGEKASPNAVNKRRQDPGAQKLNAPKFGRRRFTNWVELALNEEFGGQEFTPYYLHKPAGFSAEEAKVILLFGVGGDLTRHGVRTFLEDSTDTILINIAGTEGYRRRRLVRGGGFKNHRWGVGITRAQIEELLSRAGITVPWSITKLVAFSTGFRGLYATIMNTLTPADEDVEYDPEAGEPGDPHHVVPHAAPKIFKKVPGGSGLGAALADVEMVAIYDCLYRDDKPKVGQPNSLADVLTRLAMLAPHTSTSPIDLLVYDVTPAGSSAKLRPFDKKIDDLKLADDVREQYNLDLRSLRQNPANPDSPTRVEWLALIVCRLLKEAVGDETIDPQAFDATLDQPRYKPSKALIKNLMDKLNQPEWKRGKVSSAESSPLGKTSYRTFLEDNDQRKAFSNVMGVLLQDFVQKFQLLGWSAWNLGEVAHDGLLVEFGWEAVSE